MIAASTTCKSAIYTGRVHHLRFLPKRHEFSYRLFMMYLDLDELPSLFSNSYFWSYQSRNIASFRRRDYHRGDSTLSLKDAVLDTVKERTGLKLSGPVRMLGHLRYFGYVFNPVVFYYCFDSANNLRAIVSEIQNTPWNERYSYVHLIPEDTLNDNSTDNSQFFPYRFTFEKKFHVSPFMPMEMTYQWALIAPSQSLRIAMASYKDSLLQFSATLDLKRQEINVSSLRKILWQYPVMTSIAIIGIYWQAMRLLIKRIPFYEHPDSSKQKQFFKAEWRKSRVTKNPH